MAEEEKPVQATIQAGNQLIASAIQNVINGDGAIFNANSQQITAGSLNNQGTMVSRDGMTTLRIASQLLNSGGIGASQMLDIAERDADDQLHIENSGQLIGQTDLQLSALSLLSHQQNSKILANNDLTITVARLDNQRGSTLYADNNLTLRLKNPQQSGGGVDNSGNLQAYKGILKIQAADVQLNNNNQGIVLASALDIQADGVNNQGLIQGEAGSNNQISVTNLFNNSGTTLLTTDENGGGQLTAGKIHNQGKLLSYGALRIQGTDDLQNDSSALLHADGDLTIGTQQQQTRITNQGAIQSINDLNLYLKTLDNQQNARVGGKSLNLIFNASVDEQGNSLQNNGILTASQTLSVSADKRSLSNGENGILMADQFNIQAENLTNQGIIQGGAGADSHIILQDKLTNDGTVTLATDSHRGGLLSAKNLLNNNAGTLQSYGDLSLLAQDVLTNRGRILADKRLNLTLNQRGGGDGLQNSGLLLGTETLSILADHSSLENDAQGTLMADELNIHAENLTNQGTIQGGTSADSQIILQEKLTNDGTVTLATDAQGGGKLSAKSLLNNNSARLQSYGQLKLLATNLLTNSGRIFADKSLNLTLDWQQQQDNRLQNSGLMTASETLSILADHSSLQNDAGGTLMADKLNIHAKNLTNQGTIQGGTSDSSQISLQEQLTNDGIITISTNKQGSGLLRAENILNNPSGSLQSYGNFELLAGQSLTSSGNILADGDLILRSNYDTNQIIINGGVVQALGTLNISAEKKGRFSQETGWGWWRRGLGSLVINDGQITGDNVDISLRHITLEQPALLAAMHDLMIATEDLSVKGSTEKTARIIAAASGNGGTADIKVKKKFTNNGLLLSLDTLKLIGSAITNSATGGISALNTLMIDVSSQDNLPPDVIFMGSADAWEYDYEIYNHYNEPEESAADLINDSGLIYAGNQMELQADTMSNTGSGTIYVDKSNGIMTINANTLINNRIITSGGDIDIKVKTLKNEVAGGDTREWIGRIPEDGSIDDLEGENVQWDTVDGYFYDENTADAAYHYAKQIYYWNRIRQGAIHQKYKDNKKPDFSPQIQAGKNMWIGFNQASNLGGILYAKNIITLHGESDGAEFVNDNLGLKTKTFSQYVTQNSTVHGNRDKSDKQAVYTCPNHWYHQYFYDTCGPSMLVEKERIKKHNPRAVPIVANIQVITENELNAGIYASTLVGKGFALKNNGDTTDLKALDTVKLPTADEFPDSKILPPSAGDTGTGSAKPEAPDSSSDKGSSPVTEDVAHDPVKPVDADDLLKVEHDAYDAEKMNTGNVIVTRGDFKPETISTAHFIADNELNGIKGTEFGGINIPLPGNPNGLYVTSQEPDAKYLVQANQNYNMNITDIYGSDYLAKEMGYLPDTIGLRLGDASYENYLVQQQIVAQTGRIVLADYENAQQQMHTLLDNAVKQNRALGLQIGQALTPEQQNDLSEDLVWMVSTVVQGKTVLVPVVYLSKSTRQNIIKGGVIDADNMQLNVTSLTNTGGMIRSKGLLAIKSQKDIKNSSGLLKGDKVIIKSTDGNIINETLNISDRQAGGKGTISADSLLWLDAKEDIKNIGAQIVSLGNAALQAGKDIHFDTVVTQNSNGLQQHTSDLAVAGDLHTQAMHDVILAGTNLEVNGSAFVKAGHDLQVLDRHAVKRTTEYKTESGFFKNGALYSSTDTEITRTKVSSVGSKLNIAGNATFVAGETMLVQGSDMNVGGNGIIKAKNFLELAGTEFEHTETREKTSSFMKVSAASDKDLDSWSGTYTSKEELAAKAGAGAKAEGYGEAGLAFTSDKTSAKVENNTTSKASKLHFANGLHVDVEDTALLSGSELTSDGKITIDAKHILELAAINQYDTSTDTTEDSFGLLFSTDNTAEAHALAGVSRDDGIELSAGASITSENRMDLSKDVTTHKVTSKMTHTGSLIQGAAGVDLNAKDLLTEGSTLKSDGDIHLNVDHMRFGAVYDTDSEKESSDSSAGGFYLDGKLGLSWWNAEASAEGGISIQKKHDFTEKYSTTGHGSVIEAGGNITRTAISVVDEGSQIKAGGDFIQHAKNYQSLAIENTSSSLKQTSSDTLKLGGGMSESVSILGPLGSLIFGGEGGSSTPGGIVDTIKKGMDMPGYGSLKDQKNSSVIKEGDTDYIGTSITAGGKIISNSTGKTTLENIDMHAGDTVEINGEQVEQIIKKGKHKISRNDRDSEKSFTVSPDITGLGPRSSTQNRLPTTIETEKEDHSGGIHGDKGAFINGKRQ